MATVVFLEPGTDATQDLSLFAATNTGGNATIAADSSQQHTGSYSIKAGTTTSGLAGVLTNSILGNAGGCISTWVRFDTIPSNGVGFLGVTASSVGSGQPILEIVLAPSGKLIVFGNNFGVSALGTTVLSVNTWYRITFAWAITSTSVWSSTVYINGVSELTPSNADVGTLASIGVAYAEWGHNIDNGNTQVMNWWFDDLYIDNRTDKSDPGNILVTAKRPFANGTTNGFTTQIGAGGSGYGSGHTPQVNERPLSQTNGWSILVAGSAITEEYNIEGVSVGDVDLTSATIVGVMGWLWAKSSLTETDQIIVDGTTTNVSVTSTPAAFLQVSPNPTTYPAGTGSDIGMKTNTTAATASLYECGILIAYIAAVVGSRRRVHVT